MAIENIHRLSAGVPKIGTCIPTQDPDTLEQQHLDIQQLLDFFADDANAAIRGSSDGGVIYLYGNSTDNGSVRFNMIDETAHIEKLVDGVWEHASFMSGAASVWLGEAVAIAAVGHSLASEEPNGTFGLLAHSTFDKNTMLSIDDLDLYHAYLADDALSFQDDFSHEWTGKTHSFTMASPADILVKSLTYKTGSTAAGANVRIRYYIGTDNTGKKIFDQSFAPSIFAANIDAICLYSGILEFDSGTDYFVEYNSTADFSLMMNAAGTIPWMTGNASYVRLEKVLQTAMYVDGGTYGLDQWIIHDRKIYICNVAGVQTGTWASNAAKWDILSSSVANNYWEKIGNDLRYRYNGVDRFFSSPDITRMLGGSGGGSVVVQTDSASMIKAFSVLKMTNDTLTYNNGSGNDKLTIDNSGISLDASTAITGASFTFNDSARDRIVSNATLFGAYSPDGLKSLTLNNTDLIMVSDVVRMRDAASAPRFEFDSGGTKLLSPDNNNFWILMDTETLLHGHFSVRDPAMVYRIAVDATGTGMTSPDGLKGINVNNTNTVISDGVRTRMHADAVETRLTGPDGDYIRVDTLEFTYYDGTRDRIKANSVDSRLESPDGLNLFYTNDTYLSMIYGATKRVDVDATNSMVMSPDAANKLVISDAAATLNMGATSIALAVSGLTVQGDEYINGDLNVTDNVRFCTNNNAKTVTIAPYNGPEHAGGVLHFEGGQFHDDWHIDNFWGIQRHYMMSSDAAVIQMQNVGTGTCQLQVDGNVVITGNDAFDTIGDTASLWFGPTAGVSIIAQFEDMLDIKGHAGIRFSDVGTFSYFMLSNGRVYMQNLPTVDPVSAGQLWKSGTALHVSAG